MLGLSLPNKEATKASKKPEKKKKAQKEDEQASTENNQEVLSHESVTKSETTEDTLESWEDLDNGA